MTTVLQGGMAFIQRGGDANETIRFPRPYGLWYVYHCIADLHAYVVSIIISQKENPPPNFDQ